MDKNMIFCNKIWRHFRKESLCNCNFCILYFVYENARTADYAYIEPTYKSNFKRKRRCLRIYGF